MTNRSSPLGSSRCDPGRQRQSVNQGLIGGFSPFGSKPPDTRKLEAARAYVDKKLEEEKKKVKRKGGKRMIGRRKIRRRRRRSWQSPEVR